MISSEEFNCLFCRESFDSKQELQIHFRKHGDPKFNQSPKKPQSEMAAYKAEEGEVVNCDVCEEVFPTISKAITHKHKMHPDHDAKYFCPWCGKLFTMKHLYSKHIHTTHDSKEQNEESGFHCDYCNVDFFVPSAMIYHNKFFHRQDTELAAIGHSKKLKMFNQEPLQIYYCPFCGEEYCNKVNLHKHMGDDHIDENQTPEDVLRCPLCEAVFYHLDAYELHLTFHSTEDQYSEENELIKEITEFSLETVPPIMEKVENESQEEEPTETIGIEELLQQGMNESNDNDTNDGSGPRKKKKHKKHKKSKKTITLDEFLNMHSDVLGEGLDVEGIMEVPSQVITKQLRKPQIQRLKPGPKPLPSELQKLKKNGIVIKKKSAAHQGLKISKKPVCNTPQVGTKIKTSVESKPDEKTSSNEILTRLLNKSNSQIKIFKKSADGHIDTAVTSTNSKPHKKERDIDHDTGTLATGNENGDIHNTEDISEAKDTDQKENQELDNKRTSLQPGDDQKYESDNNCSIKYSINDSYETKQESKCSNKNMFDEEAGPGINYICSPSNDTSKKEVNTINALRNISQHVTIKSLSSPKTAQYEREPSPVKQTEDDQHMAEKEPNHEENNISKENPPENKKNLLHAIKHLSNLTVKSTNQYLTSSNVPKKDAANNDVVTGKNDMHETIDKNRDDYTESHIENTPADKDTNQTKNTVEKLDALKNLSKHITIKSLTQPNVSKDIGEKSYHEDFELSDSNTNNSNIKLENKQNNMPTKQTAVKAVPNLKSPGGNVSSPKIQKTQQKSEAQNQNNAVALYNSKDQPNINILKQLPNITAKSLIAAKNITKQSVHFQSSTQSVNMQKVQNSIKQVETKQEEIEIFNIDDSDEEDAVAQAIVKKLQKNNPSPNIPKIADSIQNKSMDVLKNLSKHITITTKNQPSEQKFSDPEDMLEEEPHADDPEDEYNEIGPPISIEHHVNTLLQDKLKSLSNISMKSRNSSPKNQTPFNSPKQKLTKNSTKVYDSEDDHDPDFDDIPGKVKITELPDDYTSDEDTPLQKYQKTKSQIDDNDIEPHSDNNVDYDQDAHVDEDDIEAHIEPTTLRKATPNISKTPAFLNNLKNLTVKSLKENKTEQVERISEDVPKDNPITSNKNKQLAIRQVKQEGLSEDSRKTSNPIMKQQIRRPVNQNTSTSSTVNKEVTVQTFQTDTIIEEITTTVTKTIRKVNQTIKQEVQNINQDTSYPTRPQKIQAMRPNQQVKYLQGMSVRQAPPNAGPRMRPPVTPTRPAGPQVRPNKPVSVRPGLNVARLSHPRVPGPKRGPTPSTSSPHKPVIGKPLKISPNAMVPVNKRPAEEASGPFSCFKKPKESLFPVASDFSADSDTAMQCASSTQMSRSNFTSMTKSVKGNSVVTSTQMKSEVSASSEQLSRLNSMSGLKVMKTSQVRQTSKVEERSEVSPATQTALSAIEKLQRQGLLVKKPRIEEPEDSDHSNPDVDDDYYDT